jgi:glycosyltransferase involved in cell wall biosynthesis
MTLVASMVCKNEMGRYLDIVIPHLLSFCDEIRVIDDGSTDGTFEYLLRQDRVSVGGNAGKPFMEHESELRNRLLMWTMEASPTYVLSIDADEFVGSPEIVRECMAKGEAVYTLQMDEVWMCSERELCLRVDGLWGPRKCPILWKAPARLGGNWMIPDRKLACGREPLAVRRAKSQISGSSVFHFGWTRTAERVARAERYFVHDQGKFHQDRHLQSILFTDEQVVVTSVPWPTGIEPWRAELAARAQ